MSPDHRTPFGTGLPTAPRSSLFGAGLQTAPRRRPQVSAFRFPLAACLLAAVALSAFLFPLPALAALSVSNTPATNITATAATIGGELTATNGLTATNILYWGTTDATTNAASWQAAYTNTATQFGPWTTNLTSLTPATRYYYRASSVDTTGVAWASVTASFTTLANAPTNAPTVSATVPLMVDTNGTIVAPSNWKSANNLADSGSITAVADRVTTIENQSNTWNQVTAKLDTNHIGNATINGALDLRGSLTVSNSLTVFESITGNGTANRLPNQLASDGASILTRDLGDTRYGALGWHVSEYIFNGVTPSYSMAISTNWIRAIVETENCISATNAGTDLIVLLASVNGNTTNSYLSRRGGESTSDGVGLPSVATSVLSTTNDAGFRVTYMARTNSTIVANTAFYSFGNLVRNNNTVGWFNTHQGWTVTTDQANAGQFAMKFTAQSAPTNFLFWASNGAPPASGSVVRIIWRNR